MKQFDVLVIGGGHAGCEAAHAAARMGCNVALVTMSKEDLGVMSCNPAIGGIGKGHIVREIDAFDGLMGRVADKSSIQFRLLNRSKGPAVQGPRAQIDRQLYRCAMVEEFARLDHLKVVEAEVVDLLMERNRVTGVTLADGMSIAARETILTSGTFLKGVVHIGHETFPAGRMGAKASTRLAERIADLDLPIGRLKTGTPPRLDGKSIDWPSLEEQKGDDIPTYFSFLTSETVASQVSCGITHTNPKTHEIIANNLDKSAMYGGQIDGTGPRYCPSIEDKVVRFSEKASHQVFLEPEGLSTNVVYPNGISTSLPRDVQDTYVKSIAGLEHAKILQYGYAIEYDYVDPRALESTLRVLDIDGLFLAGQINGTTGYEEAGGQGLVAGINAGLAVQSSEPLRLRRTDSYLGVMLDDLTTMGVTEPYRMFTSRAEYRLSLRADNADQRLTPIGQQAGCVSEARYAFFQDKLLKLEAGRQKLSKTVTSSELVKHGFSKKADGKGRTLNDVLAFPGVKMPDLEAISPELRKIDVEICAQLEREALYSNYIERQKHQIERMNRDEALVIPAGFSFENVEGLSGELKDKLSKVRPQTLAQAARIEGMTPSALALLLVVIRRAA